MQNGTGYQGLLNVMSGGYFSGPTKPAGGCRTGSRLPVKEYAKAQSDICNF